MHMVKPLDSHTAPSPPTFVQSSAHFFRIRVGWRGTARAPIIFKDETDINKLYTTEK